MWGPLFAVTMCGSGEAGVTIADRGGSMNADQRAIPSISLLKSGPAIGFPAETSVMQTSASTINAAQFDPEHGCC